MLLYKNLIKNFVSTVKAPKISVIKRIILYPFLLAILFIGIRGGVSLGIMDWGEAFFSQYNIVNQATLNPIFNFTKDLYYIKKNNDVEKFHYFKNPKESLDLTKKILISNDENATFHDSKYPLYRTTKHLGSEKKYNIVIILMESFTAEYVGCLGNKLNLSPNFDRLAKNGVLFTNFYSAGQRTNAAISSTLCSYIPLSGHSLMVRVEGQQKIPSIASILKNKGYSTLFIYGGDTKFDNMEGFLIPKGFDRVLNQYDFPQNLVLNKWGIPDENVFDRMALEIDNLNKQNKSFMTMMLTITNHPPYTVPNINFGKIKTGSDLDDSYNTFKYSDYALGKFFEKISKKNYFENTIFVILGDHAQTLHHELEFDYRKSFVPCLIYAPKILKPQVIDKLCGQIDIAPTIFTILNMTNENAFCGKNMLKPKNLENDFAIILSGSDMGYLKNGFFYHTKVGTNNSNLYKYNDFSGTNYKEQDIFKNMEREAYALEETTYSLFKSRKISK
jgi:phosphoglycerol transferase MdoB-like AlkP superfamily enzyme